MRLYQVADAVRYTMMDTDELRDTFLLEGMFESGAIECAYVDLDRAVVGAAVPTVDALKLEPEPELRAEFFCQRRELGVLNVGGAGAVTVDGTEFALGKLDCLYVGKGSKEVTFSSLDAERPAAFYLLSYPAHAEYPTAMVRFAEMEGLTLGSTETANRRTIYKAIFEGKNESGEGKNESGEGKNRSGDGKNKSGASGLKSCQLVMGFTLLETGSVWNTMPPHTHMRRSEIYFYFDVDPAHRVMHLMGPPEATAHLVVGDREVVVSPGWSIHAGVGTKNYGFCWGMGGGEPGV